MRHYPSQDDILVMPEDLIAFAWSAPMRDIAAKLKMSDVGLRKLLATHGIFGPPQGHWNKLRAGKPVATRPPARARRPGESGRIRLDPRFAGLIPAVAPIPPCGPFASAAVPEGLAELLERELKEIGQAKVPRSLDGPHRGSRDLLAKEGRLREKRNEYSWKTPLFDTPLAQRELRILNGIFLALAKRGHDGAAYESNEQLQAHAIVGETRVVIEFAILGKHRTVQRRGYSVPAGDLPASTPLTIRIDSGRGGEAFSTWCDDKAGNLESKLSSIVASIIVAGEARFRKWLSEMEKWEQQRRQMIEDRKTEAIANLNRERLANLFDSGELLRRAKEIRELVAGVRAALAEGQKLDDNELAAWETWALAEANKIDPVRSGQFMSHFKMPTLDGD